MALLSSLRVAYSSTPFTEDQLVSKTNPFLQFQAWFDEALKCDQIQEANAMCLATCTADARPSCRMVLLKFFDENGFKFYTNLESRKGKELAENPYASLLFFWPPLHRQVRIEGRVEKVSDEDSTKYFQSRPILNQISATVSDQSREVESREQLKKKHDKLRSEVEHTECSALPKPSYWGGFCIVPTVFEFWQGQGDRLHDRLVFVKTNDCWDLKRLAP